MLKHLVESVDFQPVVHPIPQQNFLPVGGQITAITKWAPDALKCTWDMHEMYIYNDTEELFQIIIHIIHALGNVLESIHKW